MVINDLSRTDLARPKVAEVRDVHLTSIGAATTTSVHLEDDWQKSSSVVHPLFSASSNVSTMPGVFHHPELLDIILSEIVSTAKFYSWFLSLRLVNHDFNDHIVNIFFIRRHRHINFPYHSCDCTGDCSQRLCRAHVNRYQHTRYVARVVLQGLLGEQPIPEIASNVGQLVRNLRPVVPILREEIKSCAIHDKALAEISPVCCRVAILSDPASTILAEAVVRYVVDNYHFLLILNRPWQRPWNQNLGTAERRSPKFWVALAACVLGDLSLLKRYSSLNRQRDDGSSILDAGDQGFPEHEVYHFLRVTAFYRRTEIVTFLIKVASDIIQWDRTFKSPLQQAILSGDETLLSQFLQHMPKSPELLSKAIDYAQGGQLAWVPESQVGVFRVLFKHFQPFPPSIQYKLLNHACVRGDTDLLKELLEVQPPLTAPYGIYSRDSTTIIHKAVRSGRLETLRTVLACDLAGDAKKRGELKAVVTSAAECALSYNRLDMFRELCRTFSDEHIIAMPELGWADGGASLLQELKSKDNAILDRKVYSGQFTFGQYSLDCALLRLRYNNVKYLLEAGVRPFERDNEEDNDPEDYQVRWLIFYRNRDVFHRIQSLLAEYNLPGLEVKWG